MIERLVLREDEGHLVPPNSILFLVDCLCELPFPLCVVVVLLHDAAHTRSFVVEVVPRIPHQEGVILAQPLQRL